jgi:hypothetical protein
LRLLNLDRRDRRGDRMKKSLLILLFSIIVGSICTTLFASVYIWTDENGVKHYSNTPPPQETDNFEEETEIVTEESKDKTENSSEDPQNNLENNTIDQSEVCMESFQRCNDQHNSSYESNVKLCEGDWEPLSALSKMSGKNISAKEHYEACKEEFKKKKDSGIESCERSYKRCLEN